MRQITIKNVDVFIKMPLAAALLLCVGGCTGSTYFVKAKDQQRYYASDIANYLFDDDEEASYRHGDERNGYAMSAVRTQSDRLRDSNVVGHLYYDPDGESRGETPYALTIRKDYRSYNVETALTEPIPIGKHKMTPHLSLGRHKDHNMMAGITLRMPF